ADERPDTVRRPLRQVGNASHHIQSTRSFRMNDPLVASIEADPRYHELRRKRNAFGWTLTILMLVVYFGYIALIAFNKPFLAQPLSGYVTTLGIPIGLGV